MVPAETIARSGGEARTLQGGWIRARLWTGRHAQWWLLLPMLAFVIGFFLLPLLGMLTISFYQSAPGRVYVPQFSADSYVRFLADPWYWGLLWRTIWLALVVTAICLAVGYPLSYWIWRARGASKALLMGAVLVPLFTNLIARLYGWQIILSKSGPLNFALGELGVLDKPVLFNYNFGAVVVGLTHIALPYFVLILVSVLEGLDRSLIEVARNLGAGRLRSLVEVVLPLSAPGLATATAITFAWGMGAYAEPLILGSPREWTMSVEAERQILAGFDWPFGATIAFVLVASMLVLIFLLIKAFTRKGAVR